MPRAPALNASNNARSTRGHDCLCSAHAAVRGQLAGGHEPIEQIAGGHDPIEQIAAGHEPFQRRLPQTARGRGALSMTNRAHRELRAPPIHSTPRTLQTSAENGRDGLYRTGKSRLRRERRGKGHPLLRADPL